MVEGAIWGWKVLRFGLDRSMTPVSPNPHLSSRVIWQKKGSHLGGFFSKHTPICTIFRWQSPKILVSLEKQTYV